MTRFAQSNSVGEIRKFLPKNVRAGLVKIYEILHRDFMVNLNPKAAIFGIAAVLASAVIALVAGVTPISVSLSLSESLSQFSDTAAPIPVVLSDLERIPVLLVGDRRNATVMARKIITYPVMIGESSNLDHPITPAFTKVLSGILGNPLVLDAFVVSTTVIAGILPIDRVSFSECAVCRSCWIKHNGGVYGSESSFASKPHELQETRPARAEGNLQRSLGYISGTFIDYRRGTVLLITGFSVRPERDEIVSAPRNRGFRVRAFTFNGAEVVVDQYCPSGQMFGLNTRNENLLFFTSTLQRYQFGFTGFKEAQNTDDRAGQYLWAGNVIITNPRYNFRLTNIPTLS